jgi:hypothetical protein
VDDARETGGERGVVGHLGEQTAEAGVGAAREDGGGFQDEGVAGRRKSGTENM